MGTFLKQYFKEFCYEGDFKFKYVHFAAMNTTKPCKRLNSLLNANIHRSINIIIAGVQINDIYLNTISLTRERFRIMVKLIKLLEYKQNISYWKIYSNIFFTLNEKDHLGDWSPEKSFSRLQSPR